MVSVHVFICMRDMMHAAHVIGCMPIWPPDYASYCLLLNLGMESGLINWDSPFLEFIDPSLTQCQEAISKLTIKYSYVTLQSLSPAILSLLTTALLKIKSIQHISLQSTKLTKEFMLSFSSQLSLNNSLTFLSIYHSIDDDDGVIALAQSLKKNKTLTDLHLSSNPGITSGSAQSLAELLLVNCTLSVLSLTRTNIDTSGVLLIAESLRTNKTMRKLFIDRQHRQACTALHYYETIKSVFSYS